MTVDRRGYRFALAPLLTQARWQLDAARDVLGVATRQAQAARERATQALTRLRAESARVDGVSSGAAATLDIGRRMASMAFLATLYEASEVAKAEVVTCEASEAKAREACVIAQRDVERFEQVEAREWADFVQAREAAQARESDADWLSRTAHLREAQTLPEPGIHQRGAHD